MSRRSCPPTTIDGRNRRCPAQRVVFGTSGSSRLLVRFARSTSGTSARSPRRSASTAAAHQIDGPLFLGIGHTRPVAAGAARRAVEVFAANGVDVMLADQRRIHPDAGRVPRDSRATTADARAGLADGIVITPSHNPPRRRRVQVQPAERRAGGYRPSPVDRERGQRALSSRRLRDVKRIPTSEAFRASTTHRHDYLDAYVADLANVIDMDAIRGANIRWASIRSAARAFTTGRRSRSVTVSTSPSSTTWSIRRSVS